jgi:hypothetical protein
MFLAYARAKSSQAFGAYGMKFAFGHKDARGSKWALADMKAAKCDIIGGVEARELVLVGETF